MNDFVERLARLAELSDDELTALETEIVVAFDAADEASDIEQMQELADMLDQVRAELATRDGGAAEAADTPAPEEELVASADVATAGESVIAEAEAIVEDAAVAAESGAQPTPETPVETEAEAAEAPAEAPADPGPDSTPETDAAAPAEASDTDNTESEEQVATEITAEDVPVEHAPESVTAATVSIRAGGDIPGITAGASLDTMDDVVDAMTRKVNAMRGVSGNGEQIIVASVQHPESAEDHILRAGDLEGNGRKIREFISDPGQLTPEALIAGGWCAPRAPIYDVPTVGTTDRPVQQGLPTFRADRGGITWVQPPLLPSVEGAVSLWRHDGSAWKAYTDPRGLVPASPDDEKPILKITCGAEQSVDVDAIPVAVTFDNMMARAFPEWIRASTELVQVAQARFAEQKSLAQLFSLAATGTAGAVSTSLGVARDFFRGVQIAAAQKRHEHRLAASAPLQGLFPEWLGAAIAVDLGLGQDFDVVARSQVNGYFSEFNVTPIWYIDDVPGLPAFNSASAFPATAHWLLFPTGTYVRLDNGELNLGVVRTKEDVQKNQYTEFAETFETVAHLGPAGYAWTVRGATAVTLKGAYSAPVTVS